MAVACHVPAAHGTVLDCFRRHDRPQSGYVSRSLVAGVLEKSTPLRTHEVSRLLDAAGIANNGEVNYEEFLNWLSSKGRPPTTRASTRPHSACTEFPACTLKELAAIAESLVRVSESIAAKDESAANTLAANARALQAICSIHADRSIAGEGIEKPSSANNSSAGNLRRSCSSRVNKPGFRERAAAILERTGKPGEMVDDLHEVSAADVDDKLAISYWRFSDGVRLYKSDTVSEALELICSAPVPGLGGVSYLEVFADLSELDWTNHVYPLGGLIRDALHRKVGSDIDFGFSAPAVELEQLCKKKGYRCTLIGDYILIGDDGGTEYMEGMVITSNGVQPPENADFSFNMLFYDFNNKIIIDKNGTAIPALVANRLQIPCPSDKWKRWIEVNGVRVCFRFFKFLLRGYQYDDKELAFVTTTLLEHWQKDQETTFMVGRRALPNLVSSSNAAEISRLKDFVLRAFQLKRYQSDEQEDKAVRKEFRRHTNMTTIAADVERTANRTQTTFFSAQMWWNKGWIPLLRLDPSR